MPRVTIIVVGRVKQFEPNHRKGDFNDVVLPSRMRPGTKLVDGRGRPINERGQLVDQHGRPLRRG